MQKTKQIVVVSVVVLLMAGLLVQPIKGLVNENKASADTESADSSLDFEHISQMSKQGLNPSLLNEINAIENQLKSANDKESKLELLSQLATKWDDVNKPAPLGYTYEELALLDDNAEYWLKAGNAYRDAYVNNSDTLQARLLNDRAIHAYEKVLEVNPASLDAKTGLGSAYVSGTNNPMAGIALLQEVVKVNPEHLEANKSLGMFSMQSRQFDRAIDRFLTVVKLSPDAESYFYLATSYENIGLNKEAIEAFEKSKQLAADPTLTQFIDRKISELTSK